MTKKKNTVRKAAENNTSSKRTSRTKKTGKSLKPKRFLAFLKDERTRKVAGAFVLLVGVFILISCISYLFSWKHDQSLLSDADLDFGDVKNNFNNVFGAFGARVSHFFMFDGYGVASFFIPFLLALYGTWILTKKAPLPILKTTALSVLGVLWLSLTLGFFSTEVVVQNDGAQLASCGECLGGINGHQMGLSLSQMIGSLGVIMVLLFSAVAFVIFQFNPSLSIAMLKRKFNFATAEVADEEETEVEENEETSTVRNKVHKPAMAAAGGGDVEMEEDVLPEDPTEKAMSALDELIGDIVKPAEHLVEETTETPAGEPKLESDLEIEIATEEPTLSTEEPSVVKVVTAEDAEILPAKPAEESTDELVIEAVPKEKELSDDEVEDLAQKFGEYDPKLDLSRYEVPQLDMLEAHGAGAVQIDKAELELNKENIVSTLNNYNIQISKIKATVGPTVTLYEIVPAPGVRISKIKNLEDDIALSLAALGIRIIAPIPGKGTIGIEVPNSKPNVVSMRSLVAAEKFQRSDMELPVLLGKTITNETFMADLAKMPHLLMAGATGQGKSVGLNAILVSLLYKKHPSQLKFVLVDPKKVELTLFNKIERHFLAKLPDEEEAIITDTAKVVKTLNSLCVEMDDRYELLKKAQCRNLKEYNVKFVKRKLNPENGHRYMPYIVLVVDEFADLIMTAGKEVEQPIARLAQLARAIGIHLIIATQRPSVNIITGTIKANFPARIAFRVTSKIDSRTILDAGGADQLIGRGDMLYSTGSDLTRLQCGFVDTPEVDEICDFIGQQQGYPTAFMLPEVADADGGEVGNLADEDRDVLFGEAAKVIVLHQQGSASLLQRKLKLGYNRAGRLVDQLEAAGIIGPFEGSKARKVLIPDEYSLEQLLKGGE